jgi:putative lipase involved disintegration of autophagic bodies
MQDKHLTVRVSSLLHSRVTAAAEDQNIAVTEFIRRALEQALSRGSNQGYKSEELDAIEEVARLCRALLVQGSEFVINKITDKEVILDLAQNALKGGEVFRKRMKEINEQ